MKMMAQLAVILLVSLLAALLVWPRKKKHPGGCGPGCMCHSRDHSDCPNPENKAKTDSE
ncbi:MAG: hypothetical protein ABFD91_06040 [Anaerohalosphaeraceae bacterium]